MLKQKKSKLDEIKNKSIEEFLLSVSQDDQILIVELPNGSEIIIQPKPNLKPLPVLEGHIPSGWKEALYNES